MDLQVRLERDRRAYVGQLSVFDEQQAGIEHALFGVERQELADAHGEVRFLDKLGELLHAVLRRADDAANATRAAAGQGCGERDSEDRCAHQKLSSEDAS